MKKKLNSPNEEIHCFFFSIYIISFIRLLDFVIPIVFGLKFKSMIIRVFHIHCFDKVTPLPISK